MDATTVITAVATQDLEPVRPGLPRPADRVLTVGRHPASYRRDGQELVVTPRPKLKTGETSRSGDTTAGPRRSSPTPTARSRAGCRRTTAPSCRRAAGRPGVAAGQRQPRDKATYTFHATVPEGVTVVGTAAWRPRRSRTAAHVRLGLGRADGDLPRHGDPRATSWSPRPRRRHPRLHGRGPPLATRRPRPSPRSPTWSTTSPRSSGRIPSTSGRHRRRAPDVGYALESQTKPNYSALPSDGTMAHESRTSGTATA